MDTSPPASPHTASISENSAKNSCSQTPIDTQVDAATSNGAPEEKPDKINDLLDYDSAEDIGKYMKYEADSARRLMTKYFSNKDLYEGIIFDEKVIIDGETIKSSRWPSTRSFADPVQAFEDHGSTSSSSSLEETPSQLSNGKHISKRSG